MRGGIFICYRREDSAGFTGRIYDRLTKSFGRKSVFLDVNDIPAGVDFVEVLSERVGGCDALIAIIGRSWLASTDENNLRRLDDPKDFVRIEIEVALAHGVRVIPVLVGDAAMPQASELPDSLKGLARRQSLRIDHARFDFDVEQLAKVLSTIQEQARRASAGNAQQLETRNLAGSTLAPASSNELPASNSTPGGRQRHYLADSARTHSLLLLTAAAAALIALAALFVPRSRPEQVSSMTRSESVAGSADLGTPTSSIVQKAEQEKYVVYDGKAEFFDYWLRKAGIAPDESSRAKIRLPSIFVGRRLNVVSFTSFEEGSPEEDILSIVQDDRIERAAPFAQPRLKAPVKLRGRAEMGVTSLNFAPSVIPSSKEAMTVSAARLDKQVNVSDAKTVWLRFSYHSDTNPSPKEIHNCESRLVVITKFNTEENWSVRMSYCGDFKGEEQEDFWSGNVLPIPVPLGSSSMGMILAFQIQNNHEMYDPMFLIDDVLIMTEQQ